LGDASAGIIIRDEAGKVVLLAWKVVRTGRSIGLPGRLTTRPGMDQKNDTRSSLAGLMAVGNLLPECKFQHTYREAKHGGCSRSSTESVLRNQECVVMRAMKLYAP
jgi:hypothetical protein